MAAPTSIQLHDVRKRPNELRWRSGQLEFTDAEIEAVLAQTDSPEEHTALARKLTPGKLPADPDQFRRISRHPAPSAGDTTWRALRQIINDIAKWRAHNTRVEETRQQSPSAAGSLTAIPAMHSLDHLAAVLEPIAADSSLAVCPPEMIQSLEQTFAPVRTHAQQLMQDPPQQTAGMQPQTFQQAAQQFSQARQNATQQFPEAMKALWQRVGELMAWAAYTGSKTVEVTVANLASQVDSQAAMFGPLDARSTALDERLGKQSADVAANLAGEREQIRKQIDEWEKRAAEREARPRALLDQAEAVIGAARTASASAVVGSYASIFRERATAHALAARRWLWAASSLLVSLLGYVAVVTICWPASRASTLALIADWVPRALVGSVLLSAAVWCARVYGVHRHNEIVNQHRLAALSTFDILMNGAPTPEAKAAIVAAATNAIYSMQPTTPGGPSEPNIVLATEFVRAASAGFRSGTGHGPASG